MQFLRQSTASQTVVIGPIVDDADANTPYTTALTVSQIRIHKMNTGAFVNKNSGSSVHMENGWHACTLNATDTNTLGRLSISVAIAGELKWVGHYTVLPANVYDSLYAGSDVLQVDVTQVGGAAQDLPTATALATVDANVDAILVDTGTTLPAQISGISAPSAASIADAVLDEALSGHVTAGTLGKAIADIEADATAILADTNELQTDNIPGTLATLATAAALSTVDANVDAILVDTGSTIPAQITGLNDIDSTAVQAAAAAALTAYDPPTKAELDSGLAGISPPSAASIADAVLDEALAGHVTAGTLGKAVADIESDVTAILADTNELQTDNIPATLATLATSAALATVDANVDAILVDTGSTLPATLSTIDANVDAILVDTSTTLDGKLNTIDGIVDAILVDTGTTLPASLTAIETDTQDIQTQIGAAGAGLTAIPEVDANITKWLGTAVGADSPGRPNINIKSIDNDTTAATNLAHFADNGYDVANSKVFSDIRAIAGGTAAATDLQDFALNGYDPATNQIEGVKLVDVTTTNTDMRGTDGANTTAPPTAAAVADQIWEELTTEHQTAGTFGGAMKAIYDDTNELQSDDVPGLIAALNNVSTAQINAEVDAALADYDSPTKAEMDAAFAALNNLDGASIVAAVKAMTITEPSNGDEDWASLTLGDVLAFMHAFLVNPKDLDRTGGSDNANLYKTDGTTPILTWTDGDDGTTYTSGLRS